MMDPRQLPHPPIREAIIDIRVDLPLKVGVDALRGLATSQSARFPKLQERRRVQGEFTLRGHEAPEARSVDLGVEGFLLRSTDDLDVIQFRMEGIAVNRLSPYQGWAPLLAAARETYELYAKAVSPLAITRVSTRFINRILLPFPVSDIADYMACPPRLPPNLPQRLSGFLQRIEVLDDETHLTAQITQASEAAKDGFLPWILDVDAFSLGPFEPNSSIVWERLESLHSFKNRLFFGMITEKTIGLLT